MPTSVWIEVSGIGSDRVLGLCETVGHDRFLAHPFESFIVITLPLSCNPRTNKLLEDDLSSVICPGDGDSKHILNVCQYLRNYMAQHSIFKLVVVRT
jgi:hypothetical protein